MNAVPAPVTAPAPAPVNAPTAPVTTRVTTPTPTPTPTTATAAKPADLRAEAVFKDWLRGIVKGVEELRAFEAGQIDAVIDPTTGSAIFLPEAQAALQGSSRLVLNALNALPGEVCVLNAAGTVVMTNTAWCAFVTSHAGAGLGVRDGANFFAACEETGARERVSAKAVAAGLRQVLAGTSNLFRRKYVCASPGGRCTFTLTIAPVVGESLIHAVVTRENVTEVKRLNFRHRADRTKVKRIAAVARAVTPNRLLAALPAKDYQQLLDGLDPVNLNYGDVLYESDEPMRHVYFPSDSLVSLLTVVEGHQALEVGLVGREGMVGDRLALGTGTSPVRALVQGTGTAMRMKSARFLKELQRSPALRHAVLRFTDSLMIQVTRTAACNRFHGIEARLARWLLMTQERLASREFRLTQEFLADMLGVRRVGVTEAASALKGRKLIRYSRGNITILDQEGLEAASCSCYEHVRVGLDSAA